MDLLNWLDIYVIWVYNNWFCKVVILDMIVMGFSVFLIEFIYV